MTAEKPHHILTLVIQKEADIPMVRSKVKLLVRAVGAPVLQVTGLAVGASEAARFILRHYGGGKVRISLFANRAERAACGMELIFHSNAACLAAEVCPMDEQALKGLSPFPGLMKVFESVQLQGGARGRKITINCQTTRLGIGWEQVHGRVTAIRRELFADTEESYMENLRAKHDEVVRLLREKTEKNRLLDQSNNELLQLSNDLEQLARERTIIEMSLRIADQVRNPATVIGGMARRLLSKEELSGPARKKIALVAAEADKIEGLVRQFNTMAAERRTLFGRENLTELMEDALQACPTLQRKDIRIAFDAPQQPVEIHANRQVLKVALVHALRYLTRQVSEGGTLSIVIGNRPRPQVLMKGRAEPEKAGIATEPDSRAGEVQSGQDAGLELIRQILAEHQAESEVEQDRDGVMVISMHFPLVFHEQGALALRSGGKE